MSRSVLFASGKGGTGKSSLCLHVAGALARRGLRVLVVEATPGFRGLEIALELPVSYTHLTLPTILLV